MLETALRVDEIGQILTAATEEVLETMFFTGLIGPAEPSGEPGLAALVAFRGAPSGVCGVRMSEAAARDVAANFVGAEVEELEPAQIEQVVCEFANMICGSVVSRLESAVQIELDPPRLVAAGDFNQPPDANGAEIWFELEKGTLGLMLSLGPMPGAGGSA